MVGELIRKEADIALAPLTITSARERVIIEWSVCSNSSILFYYQFVLINTGNRFHKTVHGDWYQYHDQTSEKEILGYIFIFESFKSRYLVSWLH